MNRRPSSGRTPGRTPGRTIDREVLRERVRSVAMALSGTTEKLSHGELAFFTRGRMFLTFDDNHHGSGHFALWCKAAPGAQESLVSAEPHHFFVPPYVGTKGWLGIRLDTGLPWPIASQMITDAWREASAR